MKLKDFKEMLSSLPEDFDDYEVIYSELEENDEESYLRTDDLLVGMISDDAEKKMCFMGEDSYKIALFLYSDEESENNDSEDEEQN
jgi:hypothetical protein